MKRGCAWFAVCVCLVSSELWAAPAPEHPKEPNSVDNMLGVTFDTGIGKNRVGASAIGARFVRLHPFQAEDPDTGGVDGGAAAWLGYGVDARVITLGFDSVDAGVAHLVGRAGAGMGAATLEVELLLGAGIAGSVVPTWGFAVLYGFPFAGIGLATEIPIGQARPHWLEGLTLALRFQLPLELSRSKFMAHPDESAAR